MDQLLHERLSRWHDQIHALSKSEEQYLLLESNEKPLWSKLFLAAEGKTVAEKEAHAFTHPDWVDFQSGLVAAKVVYHREKRILELKQAAFQSEYLRAKNENDAIQRMPRSMT